MVANLKREILDYRGDPIVNGNSSLTIGDVLLNAVNSGGKQEDDAKGKTERFLLGMRVAAAILDSGEISLTASEIVLLRDSVARLYFPIVLGRVLEELDPESLK